MSITNFFSQYTDALYEAASSIVSKSIQTMRTATNLGIHHMRTFGRERKFKVGLGLAVWPVFAALIAPASYSNRLPITIFCIIAILSEAEAGLLFFLTYRRPIDRVMAMDADEDRISSWSVIGAAAAGACALAFLVAAVANVIQVR